MSAIQGKIILTTCAADKALKIQHLLEPKGALVYNFPLIEITAARTNIRRIESILREMASFDWVVFTSSNGVNNFFYWLKELGLPNKNLSQKFAVIGKASGKALEEHGFTPEYISESKDSVEFANELAGLFNDKQQNILVPTGNLASNHVQQVLNKNHKITSLVVYHTHQVNKPNAELRSRVESDSYDLILFLSPSAVDAFLSQVDNPIRIARLKSAAIGKTTQKAMNERGIEASFCPSLPNLNTMAEEMEIYFKQKQYNI